MKNSLEHFKNQLFTIIYQDNLLSKYRKIKEQLVIAGSIKDEMKYKDISEITDALESVILQVVIAEKKIEWLLKEVVSKEFDQKAIMEKLRETDNVLDSPILLAESNKTVKELKLSKNQLITVLHEKTEYIKLLHEKQFCASR